MARHFLGADCVRWAYFGQYNVGQSIGWICRPTLARPLGTGRAAEPASSVTKFGREVSISLGPTHSAPIEVNFDKQQLRFPS
jgi:hypothetical protein